MSYNFILQKTLPFFKNPRFSKPRPFKNSTLFQKPQVFKTPSFQKLYPVSKTQVFKTPSFQKLYPFYQKYPGFQNPVLSRTPSFFFFKKQGFSPQNSLFFHCFFLDFEGYIKKIQSFFTFIIIKNHGYKHV